MLISSYLVAYNCASWMISAIKTLQLFSDEIIVAIDEKTSDNTRDVLKEFGITNTFEFQFTNFIDLFNTIMPKFHGDWIFGLDADEDIATLEAVKIRNILLNTSDKIDMYYFPRYHWLDYKKTEQWTAAYPDYQRRLFRKNIPGLSLSLPVHGIPVGSKNSKLIPENIHINHYNLLRPYQYRLEIRRAYRKIAGKVI